MSIITEKHGCKRSIFLVKLIIPNGPLAKQEFASPSLLFSLAVNGF